MVSVIVPVYNTENYLEECIQSIVSQTYQDLEILIINDGSADRSGDICRKWEERDPRIKYIEKQHEGQGAARNLGIRLASGEYLIFVDSDDYIDKNLIHTVHAYIEKEHADMCVYAHCWLGEKVVKKLLGYKTVQGQNAKEHKELLGNMTPIMCDKMYSTRLIKDTNIAMSNRICEDLVLNARLYMKAEKVCMLDIPLYYYRYKREGNLSTNYQRYSEVEESLNELINIFHREGNFERYWIQLYIISFNMLKDILFRIKRREDLEVPLDMKNRYLEFWNAYRGCLGKWFSEYLSMELQEKNYMLIGSYNLRIIIHTLLLDEDFLREDYGYSSIISLMSDPADRKLSWKGSQFKNAYRERCVRQDIEKSFSQNADFRNRDYIILDLLDETADLIEVQPGRYITESEFLKELDLPEIRTCRRIPFLSGQRRGLFDTYVKKFADKVNQTEIPVILIKNFLCERHSAYADVFTNYEQTGKIRQINRELEWCYQKLSGCVSHVIVIEASEFQEFAFTQEDFPLGCEPFYYNHIYYQRMAIQMSRRIHDGACEV